MLEHALVRLDISEIRIPDVDLNVVLTVNVHQLVPVNEANALTHALVPVELTQYARSIIISHRVRAHQTLQAILSTYAMTSNMVNNPYFKLTFTIQL